QDGQGVTGVEAREAVAGKQRPVDFLLAILPAAPAGDGGKKGLHVLPVELVELIELIAPGFGIRVSGIDDRPADHGPEAGNACFTPASYAFLTSSFFHSMIACCRSFCLYFSNSSCRLPVKTRSPILSRACSNGIVSAGVDDSSLRIW